MIFQDGFDADVGAGAEVQRPFTSGLQSFGAGGFAQPHDAEAGAEALFGMGPAGEDLFDDLGTKGAGLLGPLHQPPGRPLQIALMGLGPMFLHGGKLTALVTADVCGHAFAALKQLDGVLGQAHVEQLMDQGMGHAVVVMIDHHMVVDVGRRHGPRGQLKRLGRQGQQ